jgi:hypothetical protein
LIPDVNIDAAAGTFSVAVDARDKKQINSIVSKVAQRNGFKLYGSGSQKIGKIEHPSISIEHVISLNEIKMGLLKIAYETTIELLSAYYDDPMALTISTILHDNAVERIEEIKMSDGFTDVFKSVFASVIDFTKENRHFVFIMNIDGKLVSYIKLFNLYSIAVIMSDKAYPDVGFGLVLINDIEQKKEYRLAMEELIAMAVKQESYQFHFQGAVPPTVKGYYETPDKQKIVFNASGQPICVLDDLLLSLPENNVKETSIVNDAFTTVHTIPEGFFLLGAPSKELLPLSAVTVTSHINKF